MIWHLCLLHRGTERAAALSVILVAVAALSVVVINRLAAGRMGGVFG
jgi:ABC-type Fe3+ transport system permease subunit